MTNHSKSNYIHFSLSTQNSTLQLTIMVNDVILEEAESTKFLGLHIDTGLTWNAHIDSVCAILALDIFSLRHLSKFCFLQVQLMAYFGLVNPHLSYEIKEWGSCATSKFSRVFRLQKKAIRVTAKLKYKVM